MTFIPTKYYKKITRLLSIRNKDKTPKIFMNQIQQTRMGGDSLSEVIPAPMSEAGCSSVLCERLILTAHWPATYSNQ